MKNLGTRCFGCREFGHVASKCPKKDGIISSFCVERSSGKKYMKNVMIDDVKIKALIDTGSDISLMRADEYIKIGAPRFQTTKTRFSGIGSGEMAALEF